MIGLFWPVTAGVRWLMRFIFRRVVEDLTVENLIKQVAYYAVWTLGIIVAIDAFGFDPQTVVTGLGLISLALGFALKEFIGYDSDLQKAMTVIRDAAQTAAGVLEEPAVSVRIRELGQDDILIEARFWTNSRRSDFVATASTVMQALVAALKEASIGLPDPDVRILVPRHPDQWQTALALGGFDKEGNKS